MRCYIIPRCIEWSEMHDSIFADTYYDHMYYDHMYRLYPPYVYLFEYAHSLKTLVAFQNAKKQMDFR